MKILRVILLALIVVIAGIVSLAALRAAPTTATLPVQGASEDYSSLVDAALLDYEANAATTDNVYQQQVVAAWGAKDLLTVVAKQNAVIIDNQDALVQGQYAQVSNQSNVLGLLKALVVMCALAIAAVAVVGVTLLDRRKDKTAAPAAPVPAAPTLPESP